MIYFNKGNSRKISPAALIDDLMCSSSQPSSHIAPHHQLRYLITNCIMAHRLNRIAQSLFRVPPAASAIQTRNFAKRYDKLPESAHVPVMKNEVLDLWTGNNNKDGTCLIDGTIGLGGHSVVAIEGGMRVLGIDRDTFAIRLTRRRFLDVINKSSEEESDPTLEEKSEPTAVTSKKHDTETKDDETNKLYALHHGSYADISSSLLQTYNFPTQVDGILLDLGMNSYQIANANRGFTFRLPGPLDMRFDAQIDTHPGSPLKAREIVNTYTVDQLESIFNQFADEPLSRPIAESIVQWRKGKYKERGERGEKYKGIASTLELRYVIEDAVANHKGIERKKTDIKDRLIWRTNQQGGRKSNKKILEKTRKYIKKKVKHTQHLMRCFQALRIETNDELGHLKSFMSNSDIHDVLSIGGRLVMIAFQPGEDGIVKRGMEEMVKSGKFRWMTPEEKGLRPTQEEVKMNGNSRTARLRAVEKIG